MVALRDKHKNKLPCSIKLMFTKLPCVACMIIALFAIVATTAPVKADDSVKVPRIEVLPNEGPLGTTVFARMWDFTANKQVIVMFSSSTTITPGTAVVAKETTDAAGYAVASFTVDLFAGGRYAVIIDDGTNRVTAYFKVTPKIALAESTGFVGDTVIVSGSGFAASKPISVFFDDSKMTTADTDDKGKFTDVKFILPPAAKGDHKIKVQDSEANSATIVYSIKQKMTISPSSTTVGSEVTISGSGFQSKDITIYFDDKDITSVRVDTNGTFTCKIKVPPCADGIHKIKADDGLNRSYCDITVLPTITINPNNGHVGMPVAIQGSGFRPGFPLTINYDNTKMEAPTVSEQGTFTFNFKIPKSRSGAHTISVTDGVNTQKTTFTVESTPPLAPTLNLPADLSRIEKAVHFEWSTVSDPSGVTYILEIAEDAKFSKIIASTANLPLCSFDLPDDEKLMPSQKTPYYWRVKAIDGASNEGPWSSVGSFYKGYTIETIVTNMPGWTKYTLIGLGIALVAFLFFWLGRILRRAGRIDDETESDSEPAANTDTAWGYNPDSSEWTQR